MLRQKDFEALEVFFVGPVGRQYPIIMIAGATLSPQPNAKNQTNLDSANNARLATLLRQSCFKHQSSTIRLDLELTQQQVIVCAMMATRQCSCLMTVALNGAAKSSARGA